MHHVRRNAHLGTDMVPGRRWHRSNLVLGMVCAPYRLPARQGGAVNCYGDGGSGQTSDPPGGLEGCGDGAATRRAKRNDLMVKLQQNGKRLHRALRYVVIMAAVFVISWVAYIAWLSEYLK